MTQERTRVNELSELGEFGLIKRVTAQIKIKNESTLTGVGDDCAVLSFPNKRVVVTTDLLTEGVHFNLVYVPLKHLGYKAVAVNISDICAMNAIPRQITVSLAISSKFTIEAIDELYEGIHLACARYGVDLIGGDTTTSLTGLTLSITAIGEADEAELVYRNGAKPTDLLCVTGDLGGAFLGLQLLEREDQLFRQNPTVQPQLSGYDYILGRQLKPEARVDMREVFKALGIKPTSMIDISDGLSSEILHLCEDSGVGCRLYEERLIFDPQVRKMADEISINPLVAALNGGEDYELLFTIPVNQHDKVRNHPDISVIGHMTRKEEGSMLVTTGGIQEIPLTAQGWNPLKSA
ncbi:MAG: thiamine-phosphate kinase [Prolixibacteraceae bacterium]|jgi:thiamine-monophosphate kinase|nr:thiamine-phosphate kinase [Prolixibacteraceae bacterium]